MTEIFRATTGTPCLRSPGYWKVKNEERNGYLGIVRYNRQDEIIPFFTQGDANLLANSPEMHDMLWQCLAYFSDSAIFSDDDKPVFRNAIADLLARIEVNAPKGIPQDLVSEIEKIAEEKEMR